MTSLLKGGKPAPSEGQPSPPNQPPRVIPNEPASTVAGALANGKRQVEAAK
jgi:hypothetical protein